MNITNKEIRKLIEVYKKEKLSHTYIKWTAPKGYFKKHKIAIPKECSDRKRGVPIYRNLLTGYNQTEKPTDARIFTPWYYNSMSPTWRDEMYYDVCYFKSIDKLGLIIFSYSTSSSWESNINSYDKFSSEITSIIFIDKNKELTVCHLQIDPLSKEYIKNNQLSIQAQDIYRLIRYPAYPIGGGDTDVTRTTYIVETSKLFSHAFFGGNKYQLIYNMDTLIQYLKKSPLKIRGGAKQKQVDELCALPLPTIDKTDLPKNTMSINIFADKVADGIAVLRWVHYNKYIDSFSETSRLYIQKSGLVLCRKDITEDFIYIKSNLSPDSFLCNYFKIRDNTCFENTPVAYFSEAIKDVSPVAAAHLLETFLNCPIVEKMWRIPAYKTIVLHYFNSEINLNFKEYMENHLLLGPCNLLAKNPQKAFGLNKYQIECVSQLGYDKYDRQCDISFIKKFFKTNDISSVDNETFNKLIKINHGLIEEIVLKISETYSIKTAISIIDDLQMIIDLQDNWSNFCHYARFYSDYINMVSVLNDTKNFRPHFHSLDEIVEMHDAIIPIFNLRKYEARENDFKKRLSKWSKWKFDANDTFISINPTVPAELANEGLTLHHCVKNYIDRVAEGNTNIMFIRKKEEPEKPFFTVEITNDNKIQQVHGFGNRNADTEPGLEDYIKEWAKNCKLKLTNINKVR